MFHLMNVTSRRNFYSSIIDFLSYFCKGRGFIFLFFLISTGCADVSLELQEEEPGVAVALQR